MSWRKPHSGASMASADWTSTRGSPERMVSGCGSAGGRPGSNEPSTSSPQTFSNGTTPDEVLDVDAAVAQRAALLVGLGDLRGEGDYALEAGLDFVVHVVLRVVAVTRKRYRSAARAARPARVRGGRASSVTSGASTATPASWRQGEQRPRRGPRGGDDDAGEGHRRDRARAVEDRVLDADGRPRPLASGHLRGRGERKAVPARGQHPAGEQRRQQEGGGRPGGTEQRREQEEGRAERGEPPQRRDALVDAIRPDAGGDARDGSADVERGQSAGAPLPTGQPCTSWRKTTRKPNRAPWARTTRELPSPRRHRRRSRWGGGATTAGRPGGRGGGSRIQRHEAIAAAAQPAATTEQGRAEIEGGDDEREARSRRGRRRAGPRSGGPRAPCPRSGALEPAHDRAAAGARSRSRPAMPASEQTGEQPAEARRQRGADERARRRGEADRQHRPLADAVGQHAPHEQRQHDSHVDGGEHHTELLKRERIGVAQRRSDRRQALADGGDRRLRGEADGQDHPLVAGQPGKPQRGRERAQATASARRRLRWRRAFATFPHRLIEHQRRAPAGDWS